MQKTKLSTLIKNLLSYNFRTLFLFELFYKLFAYGVFTPLLLRLVEWSIQLAGLHYLSAQTVGRWLLSPYTWLLTVLVLLLFCCYIVIDMTAVMLCMDCAKRKEYVTAPTLLWEGIKNAGRMFELKNLPIILLLLILQPLLELPFYTGYLTGIQIPAFIGDELSRMLRKYWVLIGVLALLMIAAFCYVYTLFYYILEKKKYSQAAKSSRKLISFVYFRDLLRLFIWQIFCYLVYALLVAGGILLIIGIASLLRKANFVQSLMIQAIQTLMHMVNTLYSALVLPVSTIFLSLLFYQNKEAAKEEIVLPVYRVREVGLSKRKKRIIMLLSMFVLLVLNINNLMRMADGALSEKTQLGHVTEVTAHRGDSADYPENTMIAFEAAVNAGADWIELDVQQTADGVIIVSHDENLYRTTGEDVNVWETDYETLCTLDAGRYKGEEFTGVGLCTLAEVMEAFRGRVHLNIELKPTGHETGFVEQVIDLIHEYGYEEDCVLASMTYSVLRDAKEYDEEIRTVYVMPSAYGYFADLEWVDAFSVRYNYVTERMVQSIHLRGKQIYVWTVNSRRNMEHMIQIGVDNLITDQPLNARQTVFELENSSLLNQYIEMLTSLFRWEQ